MVENASNPWIDLLASGDDHVFLLNHPSDSSLFDDFESLWSDDDKVTITRGAFVGQPDGWIHLSPVPIDRACLLPPPVPPTRIVTPFSGELKLSNLVDFANTQAGTFKTSTSGKSSSALGDAVRSAEESLFTIQHNTDQESIPCARVHADELLRNPNLFIEEYWMRHKPVIIEGYLKPTSRPLGDILSHHGGKVMGTKLSDSSDFEGVEAVYPQWSKQAEEMADIPKEVLSKLTRPDLTVVRAAHEELRVEEIIPLLQRANGTTFTAYVEYQSLSRYPDLMVDLLGDRVTGGASSAELYMPYWLRGNAIGAEAHLWFGDGTTIGKLHYDRPDNILVQFTGSKSFDLAGPECSVDLSQGYMREASLGVRKKFGQPRHSREVFRDSLESSTSLVHSPISLAELSNHTRMQCKVEEGQALFVPSFWYHEVSSSPSETQHRINTGESNIELPLNLAVNYWFAPLYDKEFPCPTCTKKFNREYRNSPDVLDALLKANQ